MALVRRALVLAAADPEALAAFWGAMARWPINGPVVTPPGPHGLPLRFVRSDAPRSGLSRMHPHLTSETPEDQQAHVARALALGGRHLDVGQLSEEEHIVLADPEGNEFCVIEAGNSWVADTGTFGDLACDGTRACGAFWRDALGWPFCWDEGEETAIQAPYGGTKVAWGGPPLHDKPERDRAHVHLAASDLVADVERLLTFGATRDDRGGCPEAAVGLLDPDGNELCVLPE